MKREFFPYFKDKVCIVTGASSGIGLQITEYLLEAEAKAVLICARNADRLNHVGEKLNSKYPNRISWESVDVTNKAQIESCIERFAETQGGLDIMFNNAGMIQNCPIEEWDMEKWEAIISVNFWAVVYGTLKAKDIMKNNNGGHIVNIASAAGLIPYAYQVAYCASKFATVGFTRSMRYEFCTQGIKLSTVCPGLVATPLAAEIGEIPEYAISPEEAVDNIMEGVFNNKDLIVFPKRLENIVDNVNNNEELLMENALKRHENMAKQGMSW